MKSIELTEEHKSKLLEMCKVLFPEYTTIPNDKNPKFLTINWFTKQGYFIHLMDDDLKENKMIHWFEFCMTHLCVKIYNLIDKYNNDLFINMFHGSILSFTHFKESGDFVAIHPVDYLYEEFKKLK